MNNEVSLEKKYAMLAMTCLSFLLAIPIIFHVMLLAGTGKNSPPKGLPILSSFLILSLKE